MPFKSISQQKWMYANKPKMAKRWAKETDFSKIPKKVGEYFKKKKKK